MNNFTQMCRVCRKTQGANKFQRLIGENSSLAQKLYFVSGVMVSGILEEWRISSKNNIFQIVEVKGQQPSVICKKCQKDLTNAACFKELSLETDKLFKNQTRDEEAKLWKLEMKDEVDPEFLLPSIVFKQEEPDEKLELEQDDSTPFEDHFVDNGGNDTGNEDDDDDDFFALPLEPETKLKELKKKKPYTKSDKFKCWCGVQMFGKKRLRDHQIARHEEVPLSERPRCDICGKDFKIQAYLATHIKYKHQNQKREGLKVPCSVCGKLLVAGALKSHEKRHELSKNSKNARLFCCDLCEHQTSAKNYMQQHIERIHLKLKK
jgi:hypothetical protein